MAELVVTGACGHLGSALIRALLARGDSLTLIDNLSTQKHCSLYGLKGKWRFIESDVHKVPQEVFRGQTVIHLAAITEPQMSIGFPATVMHHNTNATRHIVDSEPAHMVFASSAGVYGPQPKIVDVDHIGFNPQTPYARAKIAEEALIWRLPSYTVFRLGTLFGPSPGMRFHTAVNKFCWQAATGQSVTVWMGAYKEKRPYLDVIDAATAFSNSERPGVYNLVTCNATVEEVVLAIQEHVPRMGIELVDGPTGMDQSSYEIAISPLYKPSSTLRDGISRTMALLLG